MVDLALCDGVREVVENGVKEGINCAYNKQGGKLLEKLKQPKKYKKKGAKYIKKKATEFIVPKVMEGYDQLQAELGFCNQMQQRESFDDVEQWGRPSWSSVTSAASAVKNGAYNAATKLNPVCKLINKGCKKLVPKAAKQIGKINKAQPIDCFADFLGKECKRIFKKAAKC